MAAHTVNEHGAVIDSAGEVLGWVRAGGCEHPACHAATEEGRPWHAIPAPLVILADYHYPTRELAVDAVLAAQEV